MGMFDEIIIQSNLPLPSEVSGLSINWKNHKFQTKDLENCLLEYQVLEDGYLIEHVIEREYIPFTEDEKKHKDHRRWNIWKDVIEKASYSKKVDFHGKINFYTYEKFDDNYDFSLDFCAYFIYGKLDKIEFISFEKHISRNLINEGIRQKHKSEQEKFWPKFKNLASYLGWRKFWRMMSANMYNLSKFFGNLQYLIIRKML